MPEVSSVSADFRRQDRIENQRDQRQTAAIRQDQARQRSEIQAEDRRREIRTEAARDQDQTTAERAQMDARIREAQQRTSRGKQNHRAARSSILRHSEIRGDGIQLSPSTGQRVAEDAASRLQYISSLIKLGSRDARGSSQQAKSMSYPLEA